MTDTKKISQASITTSSKPTSSKATNRRAQMITEKCVADMWSCSVRMLQKMRQRGEGPQYYKIGGKVLYSREYIESYTESCLITTQNKGV